MNKFFNMLYRHRYDIFLSFVLICLITILIVVLPKNETKSIINLMENKTFDIRQKIIAKDKQVNKDIIIITVDDPSYEYLVETYGDWPIPRNVYAEILDYIQAQNPKFVLFDLLFIKSLNRVANSDKKLVEGFKNYQNTYTAFNFDNYPLEMRKPPVINEKIKTEIEISSTNLNPFKYTNCRLILDEIINATSNIGHINAAKADDGFTRTVPIIVTYPKYDENNKESENNHYLFMTFKMAIDYLNKYENENITKLVIDKNNNLILGKRKIPLTNNAEVILNWYGKSGTEVNTTFKYVSFWEILKSLEAEKAGKKSILQENIFKDKIVFIGTSVFSLSDIKTVPTSKYLPGVELHTTLFNNILDNNIIKQASNITNIIISIVLAILASITVFKIRSVYISILTFLGGALLYLYFSTFVMTKFNLWIWIIIPIIAAIISFICTFIIKYLIKSRDFEYTYKLATTDGLTELYNHRFFQEKMKYKIVQAEKYKTNFSLILIDIDFFKKFNDTYGHQAGDAVLKHVAKTLKTSVRSEDMVCRYGGEEMTIILNNANKETSINIAKKLCDTIASKKYDLTPELSVNVTISLGCATFPENGNTPSELIEYADKCLYQAKENGRNRVGFLE